MKLPIVILYISAIMFFIKDDTGVSINNPVNITVPNKYVYINPHGNYMPNNYIKIEVNANSTNLDYNTYYNTVLCKKITKHNNYTIKKPKHISLLSCNCHSYFGYIFCVKKGGCVLKLSNSLKYSCSPSELCGPPPHKIKFNTVLYNEL